MINENYYNKYIYYEVEVEHEGITTKITRKTLIYVTFISFQLEIDR